MATGDDAQLTRVSVSFHTNDEDKDDDTNVDVGVFLIDDTRIAETNQTYAHFDDHTNAGPFDIHITRSATRGELKKGHVRLGIEPIGNDTWRFNFLVDMFFEDGAHLLARATGIELTDERTQQSFGIE